MPNKTGGKNYKKMKHGAGEGIDAFVPKELGQNYGRVIKKLGGCNMLVYCNDNIERICHIRGAMRKKVWICEGDMVLVCYRECTTGSEKGDIVHKYDKTHLSYIKKDKTFNQKLLEFDGDKKTGDTEGGFEFAHGDSDEDGGEDVNGGEDGGEDGSGDESEILDKETGRSIKLAQKLNTINTIVIPEDFNIDTI